MKNHKSRLRYIDSLQKIEDDLQDLKICLAWAYVGAEEKVNLKLLLLWSVFII